MPGEGAPTPLQMKEVIEGAGLSDRAYLKEYADKPLDKDVATALLKKLDGAESLIGRKIGIPGPDAKPEEIEKFYSTLRAPKPEDYEFELGEKPDENFVKEMRAAAHKAGLSKKQLAEFTAGLTPGFKARQAAAVAAQEKLDKEFEGIVSTTFGKDGEKVLARGQEALKDLTPAALRPYIATLDNKALAVLVGVIDAVMTKYVPEDDLNGKGKGGAGDTGNDKAALQEEARKLQALEAWKNFQHPDHEKTVKRVQEIYASAAFKA